MLTAQLSSEHILSVNSHRASSVAGARVGHTEDLDVKQDREQDDVKKKGTML